MATCFSERVTIKEEPRDDFTVSNVAIRPEADELTELQPVVIKPDPDAQGAINIQPQDVLCLNGVTHYPVKPDPDGPRQNGSGAHTLDLSNTSAENSSVLNTSQESKPEKPKRVRKRKVKTEPQEEGTSTDNAVLPIDPSKLKQETLTGTGGLKERKKRDRFKGMSEEEVLQRLLPDHLAPDLDIIIIGINPGLTAAFVGHHYAGPGNHFWKCLFLSGLIPTQMNAYDDFKLLEHGIGFTNIVARTTRGSADLTKKEIKEGAEILTEKILKFKPKIAVFNGKGIYEVFCGHKNFYFGKQPEGFPGAPETTVFVMPSSSARCTQLPRAVDKVPFYEALRRYRDYLRGKIPCPDDSEVTFPDLELKTAEPKKNRIKQEIKTEGEEAGAPADTQPQPTEEPKKKAPRRSRKKKQEEPVPVFNGQSDPQGMNRFYMDQDGANGPMTSYGQDRLNPLSQANLPTASVESKVAAWHAANAAHDNAMSSSLNLNQLLGGDAVLVKQEDLSELAQLGIPVTNFPTTSTFTPHTSNASTSGYPMYPPYMPQAPGLGGPYPPTTTMPFTNYTMPNPVYGQSPYFPAQAESHEVARPQPRRATRK